MRISDWSSDVCSSDLMSETLEAKVQKVFDGDGFLASVWNPLRGEWVERVPFRFAFIDAPELGQALGSESMDFLHQLISGNALRVSSIGKELMGYLTTDKEKRMTSRPYLTEEMRGGEGRKYVNGEGGGGMVKKDRPEKKNINAGKKKNRR